MTVEDSVEIAPGIRMPLVGLGTWQARGDEVQTAVRQALELGYRSIDTAQMYGNEQEVGRAIAESGLARDEIFVTTKMWPDRAGRERETLEESLALLGLDRVDLWLIHWPPGGRARPDVWERFLEAEADGLARAVGVSNYDIAQLDELERPPAGCRPSTRSSGAPRSTTTQRSIASRRGVQVEGYSPLRTTNLAAAPLVRIAEAHGVTPARVVIRWHVEHGIVVIPKSTHPDRIRENFDVFGFALSPSEIGELDGLG